MTIPGAPTNPTTTISTNTITIRWTIPTITGGSNITGYTLHSSTDGTNFSQLTIGTSLSYSHANTSTGTTYYYRIYATNAQGTSTEYAEASYTRGTSKPGPVSDLELEVISRSEITLTWNEPEVTGGLNISGYKIERSTNNRTFTEIDTVAETTYEDTELSANTRYYYRVYAQNTQGDSAYISEDTRTSRATRPGP